MGVREAKALQLDLDGRLEEVVERIAEARSLDLEAYERGKPLDVEVLVPELARLVLQCCQLLDDLAKLDADSDLHSLATPRQIEDFADLCFVLYSELRACGQQLGRLTEIAQEPFGILVAVERARNKIVNGLCVLENRLSTLLGYASRTHHIDLIREALVARRITGKLLSRLPDLGSAESDLESSLRRVGGALAWLKGHEDFYSLRTEERLVARHLQQQIITWLRDGCQKREGLQILHEVQVFVELLQPMVRDRGLIDHDLEVLEKAIDQLKHGDPYEALSCSVVVDLDSLFGLDASLDRQLRKGSNCGEILASLLQLHGRLRALRPATEGRGVQETRARSPEPTRPGAKNPRTGHLRLVGT